jgi:hypothetical protein
MKIILSVISGLLVLVSISATAAEGCKFDTQCKGNRICEQGICVYPNEDSSDPDDSPAIATTTEIALPQFCCTTAGRLGPYPNPDIKTGLSAGEGDSCYGTTAIGQIRFGMACY